MNKNEKLILTTDDIEKLDNILNGYADSVVELMNCKKYIHKLQKENNRLRIINKNHQKLNGELRKENKELQDRISELEKRISLLFDMGKSK